MPVRRIPRAIRSGSPTRDGTVESHRAGVVVTDAADAALVIRTHVFADQVGRLDAGTGAWVGTKVTPQITTAANMTVGPDGLAYLCGVEPSGIERVDLDAGVTWGIDRSSPYTVKYQAFTWGHDGNLYYADSFLHWPFALDPLMTGFHDGNRSAAVVDGLSDTECIQIAPDGTIMMSSAGDGSIRYFRSGDQTYLGSSEAANRFGLLRLVAFARRSDGALLAADGSPGGAVHRFTAGTAHYDGILVPGKTGGMGTPTALCIGDDGVVYVGDESGVLRFDANTGRWLDRFPTDPVAASLVYRRAGPPEPPAVVTNPVGGVFPSLTGVVLDAAFSGTPPLYFRWYHDGVAWDGDNGIPKRMSGEPLTDAGEYRLVAWNSAGSATSGVVTVSFVPGRARISDLPSTATVPAGRSVVIGPPTVTGAPPFSYQWYRKVGSARTLLDGLTNATLSVTNATMRFGATYELQVSNAFGIASSTISVSGSSTIAPRIVAQPLVLNVLDGAPVDVPLVATGTLPFDCRWTLDGVPIAQRSRLAPWIPAKPPGFSGVLVGTVSNQFGTAVSQPIAIRVVGTNLFRDDFNGPRKAVWQPVSPISSGADLAYQLPFAGGVLRLTNQVPWGAVTFGFDVHAIGSWDGLSGLFGFDGVTATLDGATVFEGSFSNNDEIPWGSYFLQPYPGRPGGPEFDPRLGSVGLLAPVGSTHFIDATTIYRVRVDATNVAPVLEAKFKTWELTDESAAIDNVYVSRLPSDLAWIRFRDTAIGTSEIAGSIEVAVERSGNLDLPVDVRFFFQDASAVLGIDYQAASGTLRFEPGQTVATIPVTMIDNALAGGTRSFGTWLLDAGSNGVFSGNPFAAISIADDESPVHWDRTAATLPPGATTTVGRLVRDGDLSLPRSVAVDVVAGTAAPGTDFLVGGVATNRSWMHFTVGSSVAIPRYDTNGKRVPDPTRVTALPDSAATGEANFSLRIGSAGGQLVSGSPDLSVAIARVASPSFSSVVPGARGGVRMRIEDGLYSAATLQRSLDLATWFDLKPVKPGEVVEFDDDGGTWFYRLAGK